MLLINKTDCITEPELEQVTSLLKELNPKAKVRSCAEDVSFFPGRGEEQETLQLKRLNITSCHVTVSHSVPFSGAGITPWKSSAGGDRAHWAL